MIPLAADLYSLQGLRNLGPTLRSWRKGWRTRKTRGLDLPDRSFSMPSGEMQPVGYVVMQPSVRENYPVAAYRRWITRIPGVYRTEVLGESGAGEITSPDPMALATLKNYPKPRADGPRGAEANVRTQASGWSNRWSCRCRTGLL